MRLFEEFSENDEEMSFSVSLLLAHPSQTQGYFRHTIVLLIVHSVEKGSLGLILNRPLNQTLGEHDTDFSDTELASVPLYDGGPVEQNQLTLIVWKQDSEGNVKFYFGIKPAKACEIIAKDPEFKIRGFLGYSGWSKGQLEGELKMHAWVLTGLTAELSELDGPNAWYTLLASEGPEMRLLAGEPEDPSLN